MKHGGTRTKEKPDRRPFPAFLSRFGGQRITLGLVRGDDSAAVTSREGIVGNDEAEDHESNYPKDIGEGKLRNGIDEAPRVIAARRSFDGEAPVVFFPHVYIYTYIFYMYSIIAIRIAHGVRHVNK